MLVDNRLTFCRTDGSAILDNQNLHNLVFNICGFTKSKNNYWKPAAELVSDKEALNCRKYGLKMAPGPQKGKTYKKTIGTSWETHRKIIITIIVIFGAKYV